MVEEKKVFDEEPAVDERYVESQDAESRKGGDTRHWGFYVLVGCIVYALFELVRSILFFF